MIYELCTGSGVGECVCEHYVCLFSIFAGVFLYSIINIGCHCWFSVFSSLRQLEPKIANVVMIFHGMNYKYKSIHTLYDACMHEIRKFRTEWKQRPKPYHTHPFAIIIYRLKMSVCVWWTSKRYLFASFQIRLTSICGCKSHYLTQEKTICEWKFHLLQTSAVCLIDFGPRSVGIWNNISSELIAVDWNRWFRCSLSLNEMNGWD